MKHLKAIQKKLEIKKQLDNARRDLFQFDDLDEMKVEATAKKANLKGLKDQVDSGSIYPGIYDDIKSFADEAEESAIKVAEAEKAKAELLSKTESLEEQLASISFSVTKADLMEAQSVRDAIEGDIQKIQEAIQLEKEKIEETAFNPDHPLAVLTAQKESLLAEIATGESKDKKELIEIEKKIAKEEQKHSKLIDADIERRHTVSGLERKLAKKEEELASIDNYHREIFSVFISEKMKETGKEYAQLANELFAALTRIAGFEKILADCKVSSRVIPHYANKLRIPELNLPHCQPNKGGPNQGSLFFYDSTSKADGFRIVTKKLIEEGVDLPR